jgi:lipopolysaccharide biosynthesis glycosyltransferase
MTARTALLVISFDSQLKWANSLRVALEEVGFTCRFVVPSDLRNSISPEQLADYGASGVVGADGLTAGVEIEYMLWQDLLAESLTVDAVALVIQGSFVNRFCHQLHDLVQQTGATAPVTIAGWVGVIIHEITAGFLDRFSADVVAVNSRSDLRTFTHVSTGLGLPIENLVLSGLPLLSEYRPAPVGGPIRTVLYADQPTMPSSLRDRRFVYEQLIAYAEKHPDRTVVLKPRHRPEEGTIHRMKHHPETVLAGVEPPPNFVIDYTPISERLNDLDLMLALSSTAALEAVGSGVRTAFIADLGVREPLGNHIFVDSGLLRTFDQLIKDDIGTADPRWVDDYFVKHAEEEADPDDRYLHLQPAQKLASRVAELLEPGAVRPSQAARASAYFQSQHRLMEYRESLPSPVAKAAARWFSTGRGDVRRLRRKVVRRIPEPVKALIRGTVPKVTPVLPTAMGERLTASVKKPKKAPYDDHRLQFELATNPLFTAPTTELLKATALANASELTQRTIEIESLTVKLTLREAESMHAHGVVRLSSEKIGRNTTPPPPGVAFVTVVNDKYAPGLEALVLSLLRQYPDFAADIVVFHDESLSAFSMDRLNGMYSHFRFLERDTATYDVGQIGESVNHKRVGLLGYLSLEAFTLDEYHRVIVIDADTIIVNDISRLWTGDRIQVVVDHGVLPFGLIAGSLGRPVINSGMISLPPSELGAEAHQRAMTVLPRILDLVDPLLDNFADQKFWNLYLADRDVEFLPVNYNTNKNLIDRYHSDLLADVAVLHMTGPKPWYDYSDQDLVTEDDKERLRKVKAVSKLTFATWNHTHLSALTAARRNSFDVDCGPDLEALRGSMAGRPAVLIGNGPSLQKTDLSVFDGYQKLVFNWFVHHADFDTIAPDHLVLASHMFFGGWHTARPAWPAGFLDALTQHQHKPRIWTSYYFKSLVEQTPELKDYPVSYFLFEKPLKSPVSRRGSVELDLTLPLIDASTGVLTAGVPIALHLGAETMVLVGCDANYTSTAGSYFYADGKHTSRTTEASQLIGTWGETGSGQYGYQRTAEELAVGGRRLLDATVGGSLTVLEKIALADVPALAGDMGADAATTDRGIGVPGAEREVVHSNGD